MPGTKAGALKAKAKNLANSPNFYRDIGKDGLTGPERARIYGAVGGARSRRNKASRCTACLTSTKRSELTNGLCANCQPQDSPELRALLNVPTHIPVEYIESTQLVQVGGRNA